jgi:hypothetical protein
MTDSASFLWAIKFGGWILVIVGYVLVGLLMRLERRA